VEQNVSVSYSVNKTKTVVGKILRLFILYSRDNKSSNQERQEKNGKRTKP